MKPCRICQSTQAIEVGVYRPYKKFSFMVYDCLNCGCRFVWRNDNIYELLHSLSQSPYSSHKGIADMVKRWFDHSMLDEMYKYLTKLPKNKFIIDAITRLGGPKKILEIGCSIGYLTAYHIISGHEILGTDISSKAISEATRRFGNYFQLVEDDNFAHLGTFDVVYHVGTIGCVDDPIRFTRNILTALRPGGKLFFNAPNVAAAKEMNAVWVSGTPPPDLITIFCGSFWAQFFSDEAEVQVSYEPYDSFVNTLKWLNKVLRRPYILDQPEKSIEQAGQKKSDGEQSQLRKIFSQFLLLTSSWDILPHHALEYGMFVTMNKR